MTHAKILLVEDNPDDVELAVHAFKAAAANVDVVPVASGEDALALLFRAGTDAAPGCDLPALVLLDIKLPGIDGLEVLRRIRGASETRRIPVVFLTTSDDHSDIATSYDLGVNSYIRKPVDFAAFTGVVRQLGAYWAGINVPSPV